MLIDCADCVMRDVACADCVVTCLIGPPDQSLEPVEQAALAVLADGGLVPPLRMVPGRPDSGGGSEEQAVQSARPSAAQPSARRRQRGSASA
jgi:hypothetical protein